MADSDETNQLLREIRDILATQQSKYDEHLKRIQELYAEQLAISAQERKKSARMLFVWGMLLVGLLTMLVKWWMK